MSKKKIFLIVGRTSSGKSSLSKEVCRRLNLKQVKSHTTREPRPSEMENLNECDHYFISDEEVEQFELDMAAYTIINGNHYFTTKKTLFESDVYVIDPNGVYDLRHRCKNEIEDGQLEFVTIYIRVPKIVAQRRFTSRGETVDAFHERYEKEDVQFSDFERRMDWNYHILNDGEFEVAVQTMINIFKKEGATSGHY